MRAFAFSFLAAAAVPFAACPAAAQAPAGPPSGTYDLALCRSARCAPGDTSAAYLTVTLVLFDSADAARRDLPRPEWQRGAANGCFAVRHHRAQHDSYAGIVSGGTLRWTAAPGDSGRIEFPLYRSPDAGYTVRVVGGAGRLAGSGTSWGAGAAEISAPRDTVVAVRVGGPDPARCQ